MDNLKFVYVAYIVTTPEKLWDALTKPEFTRQYWSGCYQQSDWTLGSPWRLIAPDGRVADAGEILEIDPPFHLEVSWRHEMDQELHAIGVTRARFDIEPAGEYVKLTVTHTIPEGGEAFLEAISTGWPGVVSSVKSLLETGKALPGSDRWPDSA